MNRFEATVSQIRSHASVSSIELKIDELQIWMLGLEPPHDLDEGSRVELGIKATHILLSLRSPQDLTLCNVLPVTFIQIDRGAILAAVELDFRGRRLEAILPLEALQRGRISEGEHGFALFQASELSILHIMENRK